MVRQLKKVTKQLKKASKLHANQAKIVANYVKKNDKKTIKILSVLFFPFIKLLELFTRRDRNFTKILEKSVFFTFARDYL